MKFTYLFLLLFCTSFCFGQKQTAHWYFGDYAGIDFNSGSASTHFGGALNGEESCASISDSTGKLLFYSNGLQVWNTNLFVMPNGNNLTGDMSTAQMLIVPHPGNSKRYYIFYADAFGGPEGLRYSEVDMNLDNGLGDVVSASKNTLLHNNSTEKMTAVRHCNGEFVWLLTQEYTTNQFFAYLIDKTGIHGPVKSPSGNTYGWCCNNLKFSPNGDYVAYTESLANSKSVSAKLYSFDTQSGKTSYITSLPVDSAEGELQYGLSFSPNSSKLYISSLLYRSAFGNKNEVYQYNLESNNIKTSKTTVYSGNSVLNGNSVVLGSIQNALDGKMYIAKMASGGSAKDTLAVVHYPDSTGVSCGFDFHGLYLSGRSSTLGLPNFMESYFNPTKNKPDTCSYIGVHENTLANGPQVYPHPTKGTFYLDFEDYQKEVEITLFDLAGSVVHKKHFENCTSIEMDYDKAGSYVLCLKASGGTSYQRLIISP